MTMLQLGCLSDIGVEIIVDIQSTGNGSVFDIDTNTDCGRDTDRELGS